jgi:hypothetical protein
MEELWIELTCDRMFCLEVACGGAGLALFAVTLFGRRPTSPRRTDQSRINTLLMARADERPQNHVGLSNLSRG